MKILIADDEAVCRSVAGKAFAKFCPESEVDEAPDGLLAASLAVGAHRQREPYQLVCLDCHMPIMNGPEAAQLIRQYEAAHKLEPVTFCIISSDDDARTLFENQLGSDPAITFITKPLVLEHLLRLYRFIQSRRITGRAADFAAGVFAKCGRPSDCLPEF